MDEDYQAPTLTAVFNVFGVVTFLVFVVATVWMFRARHLFGPELLLIFGLLFNAVVQFGIAQVIDYIGRTAYNTGKAAEIVEWASRRAEDREKQMVTLLQEIAANTRKAIESKSP